MPTITMVDKPAPASIGQSSQQQDAKARAIAALTGGSGNAQQNPVSNPSSISPEERSAVKSQVQGEEQVETNATTEDTQSSEEASPAKEEPISSQYAILARKEKALRAKAAQQEQTFKQREAALAAREAELASKSSSIDPNKYVSIEDLKRNSYDVLAKNGISYDEIAQQALARSTPEYEYMRQMRQELETELQKVREEQANTRTSYEKQQAEAYQNAVTQIRNEVSQLVKSDDSFELVRTTGSVNDVVELIEQVFKEENRLMSVDEAAQLVEEHLAQEALKLARSKKISGRLGAPVSNKPTATSQQAPSQEVKNNLKTLTNSVGNTRPLSAKERALLAFKGELK